MSETLPVLYGYWRSTAAWRVRLALALKGIEYRSVPVHLGGEQNAAAFAALNPQRLVPVWVQGGQPLTQSLAIIEFLEELFPEPALFPARPEDRAAVRAFAFTIACDLHPLNNLRVLQWLERGHGLNKAARDLWYRHWVSEGLAACEALLSRRSATRFAFGDAPGLAEIVLIPQLYNARRFACPLDPFPRLLQAEAAVSDHPEFIDAHADNQPDAVPA